IWEGSGNVMCLDVQRAARREPAAVDALLAELSLARGANPRLDQHLPALKQMFEGDAIEEANARRLAGAIPGGPPAPPPGRPAPRALAAAYCASRLGEGGAALGTLGTSADQAAIIARASQA